MNQEQFDVKDFHIAAGHPVGVWPHLIPQGRAYDRYEWMLEELNEFREAVRNDDLVEIADALADIIYLAYGTAVEYGIDLSPVHDEVHRSNMDKRHPDGKFHYYADGKVNKPEGWMPPNVQKALREQGWLE